MSQYYIGKDNKRLGPFPLEQLLANGLTPDTLVWCSGMPGWQRACEVPEVAALFAPQQPQYQQPQQVQPQYQQPQYGQPQYQQPGYGPQYGYGQPGYGVDYKQQMSDQHFATYGYRPQMEFGESIKVYFNKFADFTGRARRSEFWWFYLFSQLVGSFTCGIGSLVCFIPMMAVSVRRLHDTNRSGWWYFIPLILSVIFTAVMVPLGIIGANKGNVSDHEAIIMISVFSIAILALSIMLIIFYCQDSDRSENKYGPSPKYQ